MFAEVHVDRTDDYVTATVRRDGTYVVFAAIGFGAFAERDATRAAMRWARERGYLTRVRDEAA